MNCHVGGSPESPFASARVWYNCRAFARMVVIGSMGLLRCVNDICRKTDISVGEPINTCRSMIAACGGDCGVYVRRVAPSEGAWGRRVGPSEGASEGAPTSQKPVHLYTLLSRTRPIEHHTLDLARISSTAGMPVHLHSSQAVTQTWAKTSLGQPPPWCAVMMLRAQPQAPRGYSFGSSAPAWPTTRGACYDIAMHSAGASSQSTFWQLRMPYSNSQQPSSALRPLYSALQCSSVMPAEGWARRGVTSAARLHARELLVELRRRRAGQAE